MKAQSSSWAKLLDGRVQKGILSVHMSIRACYRAGDSGTDRLLPTAIWHPREWAWGRQHSRKRPKGIKVEECFPLGS